MPDTNIRGQATGQPMSSYEKLAITSEFPKSIFERTLVFNFSYFQGQLNL